MDVETEARDLVASTCLVAKSGQTSERMSLIYRQTRPAPPKATLCVDASKTALKSHLVKITQENLTFLETGFTSDEPKHAEIV